MENPNFLHASSRPKRKCDNNDALLEFLHEDSISPLSKRLRQEFGSTSQPNEVVSQFNDITSNFVGAPDPEVDLCVQLPAELMSAKPDVDLSEPLWDPLPSSLTNERAMVLYKPVNPPLFPGGPSAGSQLLLNASVLHSGVLNASNVLWSRKEDELPWFPARKSGVKIVELTEEEGNEQNQENYLAVVPWNSSSAVNMLASQAAVQPSIGDIEVRMGGDESMGVEDMEEDNEVRMDSDNSQASNPTTSIFYEPWQQYGAPSQTQYTSLMWSH